MDFYEELLRSERGSTRSRHKSKVARPGVAFHAERERQFGDFECRHCRQPVSADPALSGVNHRNHCPYCLWSRHVDLREPGDRLAACKGPMAPVGLTFKRRHKKYACAQPGEVMIVHHCTACGALSINRIAADDCLSTLWEVFEASQALPPALLAGAQSAGIEVLGPDARAVIQVRLFGRSDPVGRGGADP